jgi:hypothetical protein
MLSREMRRGKSGRNSNINVDNDIVKEDVD